MHVFITERPATSGSAVIPELLESGHEVVGLARSDASAAALEALGAAHLYRLAIEGAPAGSRLHAVAEEGVPFGEIAAAIGRNLDLPTVSISPEDVAGYFEHLSWAVPLDNPTSSVLTQTGSAGRRPSLD